MNDKVRNSEMKTCSHYRKLAEKSDILAKIKDKAGKPGAANVHRAIASKNRAIADHIESRIR